MMIARLPTFRLEPLTRAFHMCSPDESSFLPFTRDGYSKVSVSETSSETLNAPVQAMHLSLSEALQIKVVLGARVTCISAGSCKSA